ncbi:DUF4190 domain-containing protein [Isoptericola sp. NEAU-Y5]|uniref:DUF4190 domain-containing protein n=1 Tax=Isoptericola luteus TaxID=2879484 RepID=A0ABS7ZGD1_9MICO|nr:DUF4190 domain-containing protein [Isoptericola sp. NEAU-Y5]MCA5892865.1 DUF4190 domain-containing protein [Isoptericola sp. NEAU-Y5]
MSQDDSKQPDPYEPPTPRSDPYAHDPYQQGGDRPGGPTQPDPYQADPYQQPDPYQQGAGGQGQQQPYSQPGYPQAPGYPGGANPQQPYGQYPPPSAGTDGFSIAALVTGVLMMTVVPIVLGIVGLNRIKRTGQSGKGLAIAGIVLGALSIIGWALLIIFSVAVFNEMDRQGVLDDLSTGTYDSSVQQYGDDPQLDALYDACAEGDAASCTELYWDAPYGSEYEDFAQSQQ